MARRLETLGEVGGVTVIDDFAHHPTAVQVTIHALRQKYPDRKIWALFEPRSNTSKRDIFQKDYVRALEGADQILIADVYMPEKVKTGKVLDVNQIVSEINGKGNKKARHCSGVDQIIKAIQTEVQAGDVVLLMSNGDFGGLAPKLLKGLEERSFPG